MRLIPLGVAVVAAALGLAGLGAAPFLDPPEGFHAAIAQGVLQHGDWVTLRLDGVRYFDKPPLLYWLMAGTFAWLGPTPYAARLPSALAAIACAAVTARLGILLGGPRVGLLGGLMVAANLGVFLFARLVKPDTLFILCIVLAMAGFAAAYLGRAPRRGLGLFYAGLALATLAKDLLGALGPVLAVAIFFRLTRERPLGPWIPWWGVTVFLVLAVPWYAAVEAANRGFLWYTIVDNHLLNVVQQRAFPDEDVPLGAVEFLAVTVAAFLPWSVAAPWAIARTLRRPWTTAADRLWVLLAVWALLVVGFFTLSPFKLPHYGLPAFPALALLVARHWDEALSARPRAPRPIRLLAPVFAVLLLSAGIALLAWLDVLPSARGALGSVDVATRNVEARGQPVAGASLGGFTPILGSVALVLATGAAGVAVAARRRPDAALAIALGAVLAFLPLAGRGMAEFARAHSAGPIVEALLARLGPDDLVAHEGAIENTGSALVAVERPIHLVDGRLSNLAFGSTFADARDVFWDRRQLREAWAGPRRVFLLSVAGPEHSVLRGLPPGRVHLLREAAGRRLYSNRAED